jgi:hypothetical protein
MSNYKVKRFAYVDAAILDALNGRSVTFSALSVIPHVAAEAERVAIPTRMGNKHGWRVVDRRLQALRKAGKVKVDRRTGWSRT